MAMFDLDGDFVRKLAALLDETGLGEIEYADGDRRIRVAKPTSSAAVAPSVVLPAAPGPEELTSAASVATPGPAVTAGTLTSPMVGTAYLAPEPGAAPFVREGVPVTEGDTVLIIEAMKVMNPIRAPRTGTVTRIMVQNAQPVEYGEPLLEIG